MGAFFLFRLERKVFVQSVVLRTESKLEPFSDHTLVCGCVWLKENKGHPVGPIVLLCVHGDPSGFL